MLLFLLGLLTGLVEQKFSNPRMGLAAHLEGLMNGTFLLVLGAIWGHIRLSSRLSAAAYWSVMYGTFVNWAVTTVAAILGTLSQTPITGARSSGQPWQEAMVSVGFVSVALAMLACSILILWGLRPRALLLSVERAAGSRPA